MRGAARTHRGHRALTLDGASLSLALLPAQPRPSLSLLRHVLMAHPFLSAGVLAVWSRSSCTRVEHACVPLSYFCMFLSVHPCSSVYPAVACAYPSCVSFLAPPAAARRSCSRHVCPCAAHRTASRPRLQTLRNQRDPCRPPPVSDTLVPPFVPLHTVVLSLTSYMLRSCARKRHGTSCPPLYCGRRSRHIVGCVS